MSSDDLFCANGINGSTGEYGVPPLTKEALADAIIYEDKPDNLAELKQRYENSILMAQILKDRLAVLELQREQIMDEGQLEAINKEIGKIVSALDPHKHLGTVEGVNQNNIQEAGWGVIFSEKANPSIKEALSELLKLRRKQAGKYFRVFEGDDGYRAGDNYLNFLTRRGTGPGPVDPKKGVPYYLLIVGGPNEIPYSFQYQLDVQYAVGRIDFGDNLQDYANYARNVVAAETGQVKLARRGAFFGAANPDDRATQTSYHNLIVPLYKKFSGDKKDWQFDLLAQDGAYKSDLETLLKGDNAPALLFTATHGMEFAIDDTRQLAHQGALLCQDWEGPIDHVGPVKQDFYFSGEDLDNSVNLLGLITFHFACYGAGTPQFDDFARLKKERKLIAEKPFLANLPRQLLRHGALAAVGHVERAWGYSFFWPGSGEQLAVFESTIERLLNQMPLGSAIEYFNERYAEIATILNEELDLVDAGKRPDALPGLWTANHDARNYIVVGDPAVRLPVAETDETAPSRPELEAVKVEITVPMVETAPAKPFDEISDEDWQNTPQSVRELLWQLKGQLK